MVSKQKLLAVSSLLSGAVIWGLIWYPYRLLAEAGVSGSLSSLLTYIVALALGLIFFHGAFSQLRSAGWLPILIGITAGWTNLAYVLAVIDGEIMRVLLLFYLSPFWTVIFAHLLLREKPTLAGYAVMALSLAGAVVMLWRPESGLPLPQNRAEWLGLSAGLMFALSNVLSRKAQHLDVQTKSVSIWLGVLLLSLLPVLSEPTLAAPAVSLAWSGWLWLLLIGVAIFCITLTVQYGLSHTPANQAIVIFLFELVVAAISSYFLAGEAMSAQEWLGGAMIVAASLFSGKLEHQHEDNHESH
ncbi:MAG: EamA/RhaT family transporter [Nitrosomonadales bacterium]|nr:MAG: EamA/RhaT family transporter [Nitrosomonadales bacterium]